MAGVKALVIGMGMLLLAGFVVIVVTLVNRVSPGGEAAASAELRLAAGERLTEASIDGDRILLRIETTGGVRLEVRNLADGALVGQLNVAGAGN